jgi:hypothetical protein
MTNTAATIKEFRTRAEELGALANTTPIWGITEGYAEAYAEDGVVYRLKDSITDLSYADRYAAAADWLETRASAATLAALYPSIASR